LSIAKSVKSLIGEFMCDMFIFNLVDKNIVLYDTVICVMLFLYTYYFFGNILSFLLNFLKILSFLLTFQFSFHGVKGDS
jgi:hypothetical protein